MPWEMIGLWVGGWLVIEIIKIAVTSSRSVLTKEEQTMLHDLYVWHSKTDDSGRPLWYMPQDMQDTQLKTLDLIKDMMYYQKQLTRSQKDISIILERILNKMD